MQHPLFPVLPPPVSPGGYKFYLRYGYAPTGVIRQYPNINHSVLSVKVKGVVCYSYDMGLFVTVTGMALSHSFAQTSPTQTYGYGHLRPYLYHASSCGY